MLLQSIDPSRDIDIKRGGARTIVRTPAIVRGRRHIGSTAIPGIAAKPVIDMLGVVPALEPLDGRADRLAALGYEALGEFGIPGRRYFRKNAPDGVRTHQLHVFAAGSLEVRRHLDFRDYLRAFPDEAAA